MKKDIENFECTCTYGSYVIYSGGTGWDIAKYDFDCPEHFPKDDEKEIREKMRDYMINGYN